MVQVALPGFVTPWMPEKAGASVQVPVVTASSQLL